MNDTRRYIDRALADNGVLELRHQIGKNWTTGWFNNADLLLQEARHRSQEGNLFISLNRPAPRVVPNTMAGDPIGNDDIQWITRIFLDFDPVRPKDTPSTDEELQHARRQAGECFKLLRAMCWPDPLVALSGNGVHLLYRCHLPNTTEIRQALSTIYTGLRDDYSTDFVTFDRAVRNPGRICTLYGSTKRKGMCSPDRPHRRSQVMSWPREWKQVPRRNFDTLRDFYAARHVATSSDFTVRTDRQAVTGDGDYTTLNVIAWFTAHGLYEHPIEGIIHSVKCPWEHEHTESNHNDTIVYANDDGTWPGFHCKHSHCEGRTILDVMQILGDADGFCARPWEQQT